MKIDAIYISLFFKLVKLNENSLYGSIILNLIKIINNFNILIKNKINFYK